MRTTFFTPAHRSRKHRAVKPLSRQRHGIDEVEAAITALSGCEIYGRDTRGKLVVVIDAADAGALGSTLNTIALIPDVYSASLVFHAIEAGLATRTSAAEKLR